MQANEHKNEYTKKDAVNMLKEEQSNDKRDADFYKRIAKESFLKAVKVDFLTEEEQICYARALYDATLWGLTVK